MHAIIDQINKNRTFQVMSYSDNINILKMSYLSMLFFRVTIKYFNQLCLKPVFFNFSVFLLFFVGFYKLLRKV